MNRRLILAILLPSISLIILAAFFLFESKAVPLPSHATHQQASSLPTLRDDEIPIEKSLSIESGTSKTFSSAALKLSSSSLHFRVGFAAVIFVTLSVIIGILIWKLSSYGQTVPEVLSPEDQKLPHEDEENGEYQEELPSSSKTILYIAVPVLLVVVIIVFLAAKFFTSRQEGSSTAASLVESITNLEKDQPEQEEDHAIFGVLPDNFEFKFDYSGLPPWGGNTSKVYKIYCKNYDPHVPLALKRVDPEFMYLFRNEIEILEKVGYHPNIIRGPVKTVISIKDDNKKISEEEDDDDDDDYDDDDDDEAKEQKKKKMEAEKQTCNIALEFFPYTLGNCCNIFKAPDDEPIIAFIASCVLKGLVHIHKLGIAHKDIKPDNLGVTEKGIVKIFDFGFAKERSEANTFRKSNYSDAIYSSKSGSMARDPRSSWHPNCLKNAIKTRSWLMKRPTFIAWGCRCSPW
jgi:hypothetical protein